MIHALLEKIISVSSMAINHSKAAWGPDADEFRPERWMSTNKVAASGLTQGWSGMFTFLEGPRICIGYRMGESKRRFPCMPIS